MESQMLLFILLPVLVTGAIIKNWDFESSTFSQSAGWWCLQCTATTSSDSHTGSHSVNVTNRKHDYSGITQILDVRGGHRYAFRAYAKILNTAKGKLYDSVNTVLVIKDQHGFSEVRLYYKTDAVEVNYLLDTVSIEEVPHVSDLVKETNTRIDQLRKADINIKVTDNGIKPSGLTVEVKQTSSEFAWGSVVKAKAIVDSEHKKYQDYFYDNFEWAVLGNALKWYAMERKEVRGHNIFWAVDKFAPSWQHSMYGDVLREKMQKRINESVGHFKGKLPHWDVNNENLHGDFYAQHLHDPDTTEWMFRQAHKADPSTLLFLNDYNIVAGTSAVALEDQAVYLMSRGVPVHRVGIQSHLDGGPVDIDSMKHRLDEVARAGLKLWITELDISDSNENTKADKYEQVLRLYFGHPAIEGVLFWGFWDALHWRPKAALANGDDVTPNAAGRRVRQLIKEEWRTNESHDVREGQTVKVRGFKGGYSVHVKQNDHVIKSENFTLGNGAVDVTINLSGTDSHLDVSAILVG